MPLAQTRFFIKLIGGGLSVKRLSPRLRIVINVARINIWKYTIKSHQGERKIYFMTKGIVRLFVSDATG